MRLYAFSLQGSVQLGENYVQLNFENNFYAVPYLLCHDLGLSTGKHAENSFM